MKTIFFLLLFTTLSFAGDEDRVPRVDPGYLGSFSIDAQNALGFSNMIHSAVGEIASANPASLDNFSEIAIGVDFHFQTVSEKTLSNFSQKITYAKSWLPASFGFVLPLKNWRVGLGFSRKYSEQNEINSYLILLPDGIKNELKAEEESIIYSPSFMASYSFGNLFTQEDRLIIGGQFFWNTWKVEGNIGEETSNLKTSGINWKAGILYRVNRYFGMGLTYESKFLAEGTLESSIGSIVYKNTKSFITPSRLALGVELSATERLSVAGTVVSYFWSEVKDNYKNSLNISFNTICKISEPLSISLGFYQLNRIYEPSDSFLNRGETIGFLSAGIKAAVQNFDLRLEVLDSRLFSSDRHKFTVGKIGLDYVFDMPIK
ncbi:MAG TPA: hypothetical protein ENK44_15255 [Caldithrix abyssi]|uniref:PorV/PorQ family protein n=1 Tax=Caldithrix abyssi TaxID=187145 RepID=A0A7V4WWC6_CALAY|nr:hypothetical protein [Caldithrix abyssi]